MRSCKTTLFMCKGHYDYKLYSQQNNYSAILETKNEANSRMLNVKIYQNVNLWEKT